jgi:hypothetical protein
LIEKPRHHFSMQLNFGVWNIIVAPGKKWLIIEQRDEVKREVTILAVDYENKRIVWQNASLPEPWWINLMSVSPNSVSLKIFENTANPDRTSFLSLSLEDGKIIDRQAESEGEYTNQVQQPFQYIAGEPEFKTVEIFLKTRLNIIPLLGAEYLESHNFIFVSWYFGNPGIFTNTLGCFNKAGELLWQDEIGTNLKGIGINTFFIAHDYLFFVKNKTELVTFRIV